MNFTEFETKVLQSVMSFLMGFGGLYLMVRSIAKPIIEKFGKITESVLNIEKLIADYDTKIKNVVENHNKLEKRVEKIEDVQKENLAVAIEYKTNQKNKN